MLSVKELKGIVGSIGLEEFKRQVGPFALIQRPPDAIVQQRALQLGAKRTVGIKRDGRDEGVSLLFEFDELSVATLPPIEHGMVLTVGRMPDCELVVDDPSVSKHHAQISWDPIEKRAAVQDLKSSNGTLLNGDELHMRMYLKDGDMLSFGDARFCFLISETLFAKLTTGKFTAKRA